MKNQHNIFYRIISVFCRKIIYRVQVEGAENIPESGPLILCANHTSKHDPVVIDTIVKRKVKTMAKKESFSNKFASAIIRAAGAFPVDRSGNDVAAIKYSVKLLKDGGVLCIFPQGTRRAYTDPRKTETHDGLGYFVCKAKATVVPVCIQTKYMKVKAFQRTYVTFGAPMTYESFGIEKDGREAYQRVTNECFDAICKNIIDERSDFEGAAKILAARENKKEKKKKKKKKNK